MAGDLGTLVQDLGGAVGSLFTSQGNAAQATDFQGAASLAEQNAQLTAASTRIQEMQTARQVSQTLGTQQADIAGAGFTESGSALDLMKSSAQQGSLAKSLVNIQGSINENSYASQAGADLGLASAAKEASTAGTISAIASVGGALISGTNQLLSAGKTVAQGANGVYNYLTGSSGSGIVPSSTAGGTLEGPFQATGESYGPFQATGQAYGPVQSLTDQSITQGANITLDTSGLSIGDDVGQAASAVSDAFSSATSSISSAFSSAGQILPGVGDVLAAYNTISDIASGSPNSATDVLLGSSVANIPVIGPAISGAVNGVVDAVSSVGSAIGSFFGSIICTALYHRGMLTRSVWWGAQKYGRDIAPAHVYYAYILWGKPIANMVAKHKWFAKLVAPVFVPWAHELAVLAGEKTARSTFTGRAVFKVTYAFSSVLGKVLYKGNNYAART